MSPVNEVLVALNFGTAGDERKVKGDLWEKLKLSWFNLQIARGSFVCQRAGKVRCPHWLARNWAAILCLPIFL